MLVLVLPSAWRTQLGALNLSVVMRSETDTLCRGCRERLVTCAQNGFSPGPGPTTAGPATTALGECSVLYRVERQVEIEFRPRMLEALQARVNASRVLVVQ